MKALVWMIVAVIVLAGLLVLASSLRPPPAVGVGGMPPIAPATRESCSPTDITVEIQRLRKQYDYAYATGRIVNRCARATGVQVKMTMYGANGQILGVDDIWPASTNNIPAGSDFPFEHQTDWVPGAVTMDAQVIATRGW